MKISKSLDIDLNIISPQKHIRIHEGDVDSVDILIGVSVDDESVDLTGVTIKYDATINNYLAEQDAAGSVVDDKISIPITQNMTAMSGLLLIDVRMIQSDQILFTQTICATVEKAVVNGSTYIDFDKITIIQRMNALEEKMDYIEELVENFDTSKLIVSTNRPPSGAPSEVDVDLLRVGDTWIQQGHNIVYKLAEAIYNEQLDLDTELHHRYIWQPLNLRYVGDFSEPPETQTYQPVRYSIGNVGFTWYPVPEFFKGDNFRQFDIEPNKLFTLIDSSEDEIGSTWAFNWREEGGSIDAYTKAETNALLADKMGLAPLNPTAEDIEDMPDGQLYGDTVNHKGTIKGGQEFYDTEYINSRYYDKNRMRLIYNGMTVSSNIPPTTAPQDVYSLNHLWLCYPDNTLFRLTDISYDSSTTVFLTWQRANNRIVTSTSTAPERTENNVDYKYCAGDIWVQYDSVTNKFLNLFVCVGNQSHGVDYKTWYFSYTWVDMFQNTYTKTEIDNMIGDIETALSEV